MPVSSLSNTSAYAAIGDGDSNCSNSFRSQPSQQQPPQQPRQKPHRRLRSSNKLKLKLASSNPPRLRRPQTHSSIGRNCQTYPQSSEPVHSGNTLESYVVPPNLRMNPLDMNAANSGMEVIKVSKVCGIL